MRTKIAATLLLTVANLCSAIQTPKAEKTEPSPESAYSPQLKSEMVRLRDAALSDDYAYRQVAHLTDNIGPRATGSAQADAAARYVGGELKKLGLEVRLEEVKVPRWMRGAETAELVKYPGQAEGTSQKIVLTALGGNTPTPADGITADVVVVKSYDELKALGREKVVGKIVLFNVVFDKEKVANGLAFEAYGEAVEYRGGAAKAAQELGAAAALVRSVGNADYRLPHTGWSLPAGIPSGAVTSEDADLMARLVAQGPVRMHLVLTSQNGPEVLGYNVVADLKGFEHPEQVVIVSGHLDSWDLGTGAIDDGAGVGVAMETAELVQRLHLHPRRTIRVIAWMDEENGGRGHDEYARVHEGEMRDHVAAIECDTGAGHPLGFSAMINAKGLPLLKPVQDVLQSFGANVIQLTERSPGADIAPLAKEGVPTLGILQDARTYFNYHHTAADTLDKIAPQDLRENAAAMAVMGYVLADLPEPLPR